MPSRRGSAWCAPTKARGDLGGGIGASFTEARKRVLGDAELWCGDEHGRHNVSPVVIDGRGHAHFLDGRFAKVHRPAALRRVLQALQVRLHGFFIEARKSDRTAPE